MKSLIIIALIAFASCEKSFLRELEATTITVKSATFTTTCAGFEKGIAFKLTTTSTAAPTVVDTEQDLSIVLAKTDALATTIATKCTVPATTNPGISCATSAPATVTGTYKPYLAAEKEIISNEKIAAFTDLTQTIKIQAKKYVKPSGTQTDAAKQFDYSKQGPYTFDITFDSDMTADNLPTVKANSKTLTCSVDEKTATKVTCTITKEQLPLDSTDKAKVVSYPVTITNVCGDDEAQLITLKVTDTSSGGETGAQSMINLSKIALFIVGLFLF